jgi:hypothetical protein
MIKPDPIRERIQLEPDQLDDVTSILEGKPRPKTIRYWTDKGMNIADKTKSYRPLQPRDRMKIIHQEYRISGCNRCDSFPSWKLTWKLDGADLLEWYCDTCYDKHKGDIE